LFGETIGHADIAVAAALRVIGDAHPGIDSMADFPALAAHAKRCEALIESAMILDYLDDLVGPDKAMIARSGETRRRHLRICALAMGLGDKGVSLLYERVLRKEKQLDLWVERCKSQISGVLDVLEKERAAVKTPYWSGEKIGHADIAVACVLRFTGEAHPALFDARYPALKAHSAACEALPPFKEIVQPLAPPKG
jgi:glutathione S-transferase